MVARRVAVARLKNMVFDVRVEEKKTARAVRCWIALEREMGRCSEDESLYNPRRRAHARSQSAQTAHH